MLEKKGFKRRGGRNTREEGKRILIVTEGTKTEVEYVRALDRLIRSQILKSPKIVGVGKDLLNVVEECIKIRDKAKNTTPYDYCVCLVDVDDHTTLEDAIRLAKQEDVLLVVSNPCFEIWLLWHHEDRRPQISSSQLNKECNQRNYLNDKALGNKLEVRNYERACKTAASADAEYKTCRKGPLPSTAMPNLVTLLNGEQLR